MRPILSKEIRLQDFKNFYWLKEELQSFCKAIGMSSSGSKQELSDRILKYLETGEIKTAPKKHYSKPTKPGHLSLDTVITENHRCSQEVRAFFKTAIGPKFHFSTYIQNYFKNHIGKTYRDVVDAWYKEEERKKDPLYKKEIPPQFEYNRFVRDFFKDPSNKGKGRKEAIEAWNRTKRQPGSNEYKRDMSY
ncbi:DUF6434 domain-containing protein [Cytobacillus sp. FJAT-54145]|uniref:DUF6434 domain-containing protein n=1 Tax=Cytobacillus spartinae TaxID=3299023 RepID=A0ABW6K8R3_9BACI